LEVRTKTPANSEESAGQLVIVMFRIVSHGQVSQAQILGGVASHGAADIAESGVDAFGHAAHASYDAKREQGANHGVFNQILAIL
jgi:hypothetical protein